MSPQPTPPWSEHRELAETIGQAVADAVSAAVGTHVELGVAENCLPEELIEGRPTPVRGIVVRFERPLRDVLVFVSSLREDVIRPLVEVAATTVLSTLEASEATFSIEPVVECETTEEALEQCDGLFLEASYSMDLPTGELVMVVGTGLLESASALAAGVEDPWADGATQPALVVEAAPEALDAPDVPEPDLTPSALDDYDAMLAAQEHAEAVAADVLRAAADASAVEASHATIQETHAANERWTQLLSGVEVELSAELGRADLALGDIASLAAENVLTLHQMVDEPIVVYVNGTPYARARLVVVDGEYGIEIVDVIEPGSLLGSLAA